MPPRFPTMSLLSLFLAVPTALSASVCACSAAGDTAASIVLGNPAPCLGGACRAGRLWMHCRHRAAGEFTFSKPKALWIMTRCRIYDE